MNKEYGVIIVGAGPAGFTDVLTGEGICFNMARNLASILCYQKTKDGIIVLA